MTNERYAKLIRYKAALDDSYKRQNPLSLYDEYEKTLAEAKMAGFRVFRNSEGEHKLVDTTNSAFEQKMREMAAEMVHRR